MKCPLMQADIWSSGVEFKIRCGDCLKEECAWWDDVEGGRCAILSLVGSLDDIATKLMYINGDVQRLADRPS